VHPTRNEETFLKRKMEWKKILSTNFAHALHARLVGIAKSIS
jgi:hypothetical protein